MAKSLNTSTAEAAKDLLNYPDGANEKNKEIRWNFLLLSLAQIFLN